MFVLFLCVCVCVCPCLRGGARSLLLPHVRKPSVAESLQPACWLPLIAVDPEERFRPEGTYSGNDHDPSECYLLLRA